MTLAGYNELKKAVAEGKFEKDELTAMQAKLAAFEKSPAFTKAKEQA